MFIFIKETNMLVLGNDELFNVLTDYDVLGEYEAFKPIEKFGLNVYETTEKEYYFWTEYLLEVAIVDCLIEKAKKMDEALFTEFEDRIINEVEWSNPAVCNNQAKEIIAKFFTEVHNKC